MISVVIPVLNEADNLRRLLPQLLNGTERPYEIIVVDGDSNDGSADIAKQLGAKVLRTESNRGKQLIAGANQCRGEVLLFLHADCAIPRDGLQRISEILKQQPDALGGNFSLKFDGTDGFSRWLTSFYAWIRAKGLYYGDSGMFIRRAVYHEMGGFRPLAVMEDYELAMRMQEHPRPTVCITKTSLTTSSRRFHGRWRINIIAGWLIMHALFALNTSDRKLARFYNSKRA